MNKLLTILLVSISATAFGQAFSGKVINKDNNLPVEFVNIGVVGKNIGTTSDINGNYTLVIDSVFDNDSLLFSCIGYEPYSIEVGEYKKLDSWNIPLCEKHYKLSQVVVIPNEYKDMVLGITSDKKFITAGLKENKLGYELGLLLKVKKSAFLEKVEFNIAACTYDSIFYRLNIYRVKGKNEFENILQKPIYISLLKEQITDKISINLRPENIVVNGDFLISLEQVKELGLGLLHFSAVPGKRSYYRDVSQGEWKSTVLAGVSISVIARVEQ